MATGRHYWLVRWRRESRRGELKVAVFVVAGYKPRGHGDEPMTRLEATREGPARKLLGQVRPAKQAEFPWRVYGF
ncbi:hypothetical protein NL676_029621 [Syzygium grande]|nr:hypothetical protein NL676_029621 [Syzygium grande]